MNETKIGYYNWSVSEPCADMLVEAKSWANCVYGWFSKEMSELDDKSVGNIFMLYFKKALKAYDVVCDCGDYKLRFFIPRWELEISDPYKLHKYFMKQLTKEDIDVDVCNIHIGEYEVQIDIVFAD